MKDNDAGADLGRAVAIGERIKHITTEAFLMRLQATNAIVMTRSRGVHVPGFEAVSEQMNSLSRDLAKCLVDLRRLTAHWLRAVSAQVGLDRECAMLAVTSQYAKPAAQAQIQAVLRPLQTRLRERVDTERERRAFASALDDARQLAAAGCVLARTAKLEASYGESLAPVLTETANAFTTLADSVDESVRTIARWIGPSTRRS